ncbi:M20 family metallopeptidase [Saccharopolyspora erythraea]|uniref:M20 family metallopeptidase n=1 Tax=Saccharopolyspora erythraea TaxID=1836 RepID=UPI001BADFB45|nr:M20 family metallopeptidase [Saccharopolyspora erythraea]QUH02047.1 M20 family metallopeptidase [Saccharopolyspora erythraea]
MTQQPTEPGTASGGDLLPELRARVHEIEDLVLDTSHQIHAKPEIRFQEHFASDLLARRLREHGFTVTSGIAGLPTAFVGRHREPAGPGPTIAFLCEYDALEEIGHGCGHNVIAAAGLGAALATKRWLDDNPGVAGSAVVLGTPAEEGGGGKIPLIESGYLDGIDAALMLHPAGENLSQMTTLARAAFDVVFTGRAAHAAVSPEEGVNALDAATLTLSAIGLLRQQLPPDARVHGIVTDGGQAPNIIPERTSLRFYVRSPDTRYLRDRLLPAVENCARGAALATGAEVTISQQAPTYAALRPNPVLGRMIEDNFALLGRETVPLLDSAFPGSTDMGNVSEVVPAAHPNIEFVPGLTMHSHNAAELAGGEVGDRAALDGATLLALTAAQLFSSEELVSDVRAAFVPAATE